MIDTAQRTILFWDVMRERGNQFREHCDALQVARAPGILAFLPLSRQSHMWGSG
jgi:hypothetical protein